MRAIADELAELAKLEIPEDEAKLAAIEEELFVMLAPKDPNDDKNIIIEIRAGDGGDESSLFGAELYRMQEQQQYMQGYLRVLEDRIRVFAPALV